MKNQMEIKFKAIRENESFARVAVSAFCVGLNPTLDELEDIKTAVSEAVTNVIVHAYPYSEGFVTIKAKTDKDLLILEILDTGIGINNIDRAMTPFYSSKLGEERSGMGFTVMESFMDSLEVKNRPSGLCVKMTKRIAKEQVQVS